MKTSRVNIFLLLIIGIGFLLSALEINTRFIRNTFNDDYDTYVQPDNSTVHNAVIKVPQFDLPPIVVPFTFTVVFQPSFDYHEQQAVTISPGILINPPDLHLINQLFRI